MCSKAKNYKLHTIIYIVLFFLFLSTGNKRECFGGIPQGKVWTVVIDPGHGGHDPGAVGSKSREKDIVLDIALRTGKLIEENFKDVKVLYTRKDDRFIELYKRADLANKNKADLFISIHANSVKNRAIRGTETWVMGLHTDEKNLELAMKENAVITMEKDYTTRYEGYDPKSTESFIIFSLMQNIYLDQSTNFASSLQDQFREKVNMGDRGVKQGGLIVLWQSTMPSVLVEVGFISNPEEEKFLMSENGKDYLSSAIFRAFRDYKKVIDNKSSFSTSGSTTAEAKKETVTESKPETGLFFTVQLSSSRAKTEITGDQFKGVKEVSEVEDNGRFKYVSGSFKTYEEALAYRKSLENIYPDAFVVALRNNKIIPLQQAMELSKR